MPAPSKDLAWLKTLSQGAAAYIAGCTSRTLRDHPGAPRNHDGSYDGFQVAKWAELRVGSITLDDAEYERLLTLASAIEPGIEASLPAVVALLRDLIAVHGPGVAVLIVDVFLSEWGNLLDGFPDLYCDRSPEDIRKAGDQARQAEADSQARDRLLVASVCEDCGKLRRGRRWVQKPPPAGYVKQIAKCPACEKEAAKSVRQPG